MNQLILHHYTSGTSLLRIIESDSIWATQIHYLNDAKEFSHAIEIAKVALHSTKRDTTDSTGASLCDALIESLETIAQLSFYVTCFSEVEDSLSQWRGYCPPGFGYSLGLFGDELRKIARPQGFELVKCVYDPTQQKQVIEAWVEHALQTLRQTLPSGVSPKTHVEQSGRPFLSKFVAFGPVLKNAAFQNEDEWRLVGLIPSTDLRVHLRPGRSMLVPYVPIQLGLTSNKSLVWNIRVGPTPNMTLATNAATHFFRKVEIKNGIVPSMVPFRDW